MAASGLQDDVTTGFTLNGNVAFVVTDSGDYTSSFFVTSTDRDDTWALMWNVDGVDLDGTTKVPVALKAAAPSTD
jgi:hypothetical protein